MNKGLLHILCQRRSDWQARLHLLYVTARLGHPAGPVRIKQHLVNASKEDDEFSMAFKCSQCGRSRSIQLPLAGRGVGSVRPLCPVAPR